MRLSVDHRDDEAYWEYVLFVAEHGNPRIFLNDVEQMRGTIMADEKLGIIKRYRYDTDGKPLIDGDSYVTETVSGVVRVEKRYGD